MKFKLNRMFSRSVAAAGLLALSMLAGCTEDATCSTCEAQGKNTYDCYGGVLSSANQYLVTVCGSNSGDAFTECNNSKPPWATNVNHIQLSPCEYSGTSGADGGSSGGAYSCGSWDPGASVVSTGKRAYAVNGLLIESLLSDPLPLTECDTARVTPATGPGMDVESVSAGDLLYELGLRSPSKIVSVNGAAVSNHADGAAILEAYLQGTTYFEVVVERQVGSLTITDTMEYTVVFDPT